jgi:hypothetical protein
VGGDDPGDLLGVVAELRWQVPVEPERGQPVHDRPGGDPVGHSLPGDLPGAVEQGGCGLPGAPELGVVAVVQLRPVHDLEMGPVGHREAHVRHADLQEAAASLLGPAQRFGQQAVALGRHGGEQAGPVAEVVGGGRVGDPGAARHRAQAHRRGPGLLDLADGSGDEGRAEVAVVVGTAAGCHTSNHSCDLTGG